MNNNNYNHAVNSNTIESRPNTSTTLYGASLCHCGNPITFRDLQCSICGGLNPLAVDHKQEIDCPSNQSCLVSPQAETSTRNNNDSKDTAAQSSVQEKKFERFICFEVPYNAQKRELSCWYASAQMLAQCKLIENLRDEKQEQAVRDYIVQEGLKFLNQLEYLNSTAYSEPGLQFSHIMPDAKSVKDEEELRKRSQQYIKWLLKQSVPTEEKSTYLGLQVSQGLGLSSDAWTILANAIGFIQLTPSEYTSASESFDNIMNLLEKYGPLWAAGRFLHQTLAGHVVLIVGGIKHGKWTKIIYHDPYSGKNSGPYTVKAYSSLFEGTKQTKNSWFSLTETDQNSGILVHPYGKLIKQLTPTDLQLDPHLTTTIFFSKHQKQITATEMKNLESSPRLLQLRTMRRIAILIYNHQYEQSCFHGQSEYLPNFICPDRKETNFCSLCCSNLPRREDAEDLGRKLCNTNLEWDHYFLASNLKTKQEMLDFIRQKVETYSNEETMFLLYFSGHGVSLGKEPYFIPTQCRQDWINDKKYRNNAIPDLCLSLSSALFVIRSRMTRNPKIPTVAILDCCRETAPAGEIGTVDIRRIPEETAILFACREGQNSLAGDAIAASYFNTSLLKHIESPIQLLELRDRMFTEMELSFRSAPEQRHLPDYEENINHPPRPSLHKRYYEYLCEHYELENRPGRRNSITSLPFKLHRQSSIRNGFRSTRSSRTNSRAVAQQSLSSEEINFLIAKAPNLVNTNDWRQEFCPGTRQPLITKMENFLEYKYNIASETKERILWLQGNAGLGKSALASFIVNNYSECVLAKHKPSRSIATYRSATAAIRSIAHQIALSVPGFCKLLIAQLLEIEKSSNNSLQDNEILFNRLIVSLLNMCTNPIPIHQGRRLLIVVDSLDEGDNSLITLFNNVALLRQVPSWVAWLICSREKCKVTGSESSGALLNVDLQYNTIANSIDIKKYLQHSLASTQEEKKLSSELIDAVADRCQGNFMFAKNLVLLLKENCNADLSRLPQQLWESHLVTFKTLIQSCICGEEEFKILKSIIEVLVVVKEEPTFLFISEYIKHFYKENRSIDVHALIRQFSTIITVTFPQIRYQPPTPRRFISLNHVAQHTLTAVFEHLDEQECNDNNDNPKCSELECKHRTQEFYKCLSCDWYVCTECAYQLDYLEFETIQSDRVRKPIPVKIDQQLSQCTLKFVHDSVREFFIDIRLSNAEYGLNFWVDETEVHSTFAELCWKNLKRSTNSLKLLDSHMPILDVESCEKDARNISQRRHFSQPSTARISWLRYAGCFGSLHAVLSNNLNIAFTFLCHPQYLQIRGIYAETKSVPKHYSQALELLDPQIDTLPEWVWTYKEPRLVLRQFSLFFAKHLSSWCATPRSIYAFGLIWPRNTFVYQCFDACSSWILEQNYPVCVRNMNNNMHPVSSICFRHELENDSENSIDAIQSVVFTRKQQTFAIATSSNKLHLWDAASLTPLTTFQCNNANKFKLGSIYFPAHTSPTSTQYCTKLSPHPSVLILHDKWSERITTLTISEWNSDIKGDSSTISPFKIHFYRDNNSEHEIIYSKFASSKDGFNCLAISHGPNSEEYTVSVVNQTDDLAKTEEISFVVVGRPRIADICKYGKECHIAIVSGTSNIQIFAVNCNSSSKSDTRFVEMLPIFKEFKAMVTALYLGENICFIACENSENRTSDFSLQPNTAKEIISVARKSKVTAFPSIRIPNSIGSVVSLAYCGNKGILAAGTNEGYIMLWDTSSNDCQFIMKPVKAHFSRISSIVFNSHGSWLVTASANEFCVWDLNLLKELQLTPVSAELSASSSSPNASKISYQNSLLTPDEAYSVALLSLDGLVLATVDQNNLSLYNATSGIKIATHSISSIRGIYSLKFSRSSKILYATAGNGNVYRWAVPHSSELQQQNEIDCFSPPDETKAAVAMTLAVSMNEELLAGGYSDGSIYIWNIQTRTVTATFIPSKYECKTGLNIVRNLQFNRPGDLLSVCDLVTGQVHLCCSKTLQLQYTIDTLSAVANCCAFDESGNMLVIGTADGNLVIWDVKTRTILDTTLVSKTGIKFVQFGEIDEDTIYWASSTSIGTCKWKLKKLQSASSTLNFTSGLTAYSFSESVKKHFILNNHSLLRVFPFNVDQAFYNGIDSMLYNMILA